MGNQPEAEGVFEIIWRQRQPGDWVAEVRDRRTDRRRLVYSVEELCSFLHHALAPADPPDDNR